MEVNTEYGRRVGGSNGDVWARGVRPSPGTAFQQLWKPPATSPASLQSRSITASLSPDADLASIEFALMEWEEQAEEGERRDGAKDAIMKFLWDPKSTNLQLAYFDIKQLPDIWNVKLISGKLKLINLEGNQLKFLPQTIGSLAALEYISLKSNQLTGLPSTISKCEHLEWLNVSNNPYLKSVPALSSKCSIQIGLQDLSRDEINRLSGFHTVYIS